MNLAWGVDVLEGTRVVELSSGIAGAFCAKILGDAGADVIKVEDSAGDRLRGWSSFGPAIGAQQDSVLFRYLGQSKRSVGIDMSDSGDRGELERLLSSSDAVIWSEGSEVSEDERMRPDGMARRNPGTVVCAITPFGLDTEWTGRAASDLTLQAWAGAIGHRGGRTGPPVAAGGEISEWSAGVFAAAAVLASLYRAKTTGGGELLDVSILEATATTGALAHPVTFASIAGRPLREGRLLNLPGIYRAKDGWIGFMVLTGQQWQDFCLLVGHPGWIDDPSLLYVDSRLSRFDELTTAISDHLSTLTIKEILDLSDVLRVPAAPIVDGSSTPTLEQPLATGLIEPGPDGTFIQPAPWYRIPAARPRRVACGAPRLGAERAANADWGQTRAAPPSLNLTCYRLWTESGSWT